MRCFGKGLYLRSQIVYLHEVELMRSEPETTDRYWAAPVLSYMTRQEPLF
jgi:hypothetical protein